MFKSRKKHLARRIMYRLTDEEACVYLCDFSDAEREDIVAAIWEEYHRRGRIRSIIYQFGKSYLAYRVEKEKTHIWRMYAD